MKRKEKRDRGDWRELSVTILNIIGIIVILASIAVGWGLSNLWRWIFQ